jgi:hypothetical protein
MSVQAQLAEITAAVGAARAAMAAGAEVDLGGLDHAVAELCSAVSGLAAAERSGVAVGFEALAQALDDLAADIARHGAAAQRQRAAEAYGEGQR